tara:strand:+ start:1832 stop:2755 length:924 start_codon:yes stop_codon:yes gene_type:complete
MYLYIDEGGPKELWQAALGGNAMLVTPEDTFDKAQIEYALVWNPSTLALYGYPNLKGICNLGAGVDELLGGDTYLPDVPIIRLVDPTLRADMIEYVIWAIARHRRGLDNYYNYFGGTTLEYDATYHKRLNIGIMGLGYIGGRLAKTLTDLGPNYKVSGWAKSKHVILGARTYVGWKEFNTFLTNLDVLVCTLPLTPVTQGIISRKELSRLRKGAHVINIGRADHVDMDALLKAMVSKQISGATLDVYDPTPKTHSGLYLASVPGLFMTPHIAGRLDFDAASNQIERAISAIEQGRTPDNTVDTIKGY